MKAHYDAFLGILCNGDMLSLCSAKFFASPLGLNVLGTKIKENFPDVLVRIYNLEVSKVETIEEDIRDVVENHKRVIVGLTLVSGNVFKSLKMAEWLKSLGCDVIVGGPELTKLTAGHFFVLPLVDASIVGFGEHIVCEIIANGLTQKIYITPNYFDFQDSKVDYSLIFRLQDHGGVSMLWGGDCHLRNQRCYFCSRQKRGFGWRDPQVVWKELVYPCRLGIERVYNTADTVAVNLSQLEKLAESKPQILSDMKIKCFINATQMTDKTAGLLKKLNAWAAIGVETCSRVNVVGKGGTKTEDNYRAIETLSEYGVPMILTFVMGLPGEDKNTLAQDSQEILQLVKRYQRNIHWITVSPLLVTLGSQAFNQCNKLLNGNLPIQHDWEFYNPLMLTEQYFENFCSVKINQVYKTIACLKNKINEITREIVFDSKGLDPTKWNNVC